jgi:ABC-type transport system involved in cytochrome c biogenesis permease subunit
MSRNWAYLSNYLVYSSMALYALSFIAHAVETAWAVRVTTEDSKKNMDYKRTEKVARIATAMMILGFILLFAGVVARGLSASRVPWGNMYEFSITGALAFSGAYLAAQYSLVRIIGFNRGITYARNCRCSSLSSKCTSCSCA